MIKLTVLERNSPPILVNPNHIVSVHPRREIRPTDTAQTPAVEFGFKGATVLLVTGDRMHVAEEFEEIQRVLTDLKKAC